MLKRKVRRTTLIYSKKRNLYVDYKSRAKSTGKDFDITESEFTHLSKGQCFYCGVEFDKNYSGNLCNGIDRYDNSKGYTEENCVPSCWICNRAKSDLTPDEFYNWVYRISKRVDEVKSITCPDELNVINIQRMENSNIKTTDSYEEDILKRLRSMFIPFSFIKPSLADKLVSKAKKNTKVRTELVKFGYTIDCKMYPKSLAKLFARCHKPDYLDGIDTSEIGLVFIKNIISFVGADKKELQQFMSFYK